MKRVLHICLCIIAGCCVFASWGMKKPRVATTSAADATMSEYFYMESEKQSILGNHEAAFALIQEAVRINPNSSEARYSLAKSFLKINRPDTALSLIRQVANSDTTHYWYNLAYANTAAHQNQYHETQMALERMARNHRDRPEIYESLAKVYQQLKEYDKALACYDSTEIYLGNSPQLAANRIELYDAMGDTTTAISIAENLAKENPSDIYCLLYLNDVYRYYNRHSKRLEVLDNAARLVPDEPLVSIEKAHYYLQQGDTATFHAEYDNLFHNENIEYEVKHAVVNEYIREIAQWDNDSLILTVYETFTNLYPYETTARKEYVQMLMYTEHYDDAIKQLNTLSEQTDAIEVWEQLVFAHMQLKQYDDAIIAGQKAIEKGSKNILTYLYMSNIYSIKELYETAIEYINKALTVCDETRKAERSYLYGTLGDIYYQQNILDKCFQYYDTALIYNPNNSMVLNNYAYNLACNGGDLLKAEKMSATALKLEPENKTFIDTYAWIQFKMESYTLARIYIEQAIMLLTPDDDGANVYLEHYGDILAQSGEIDAAVEEWKKSYDLVPTEILKKKIEQKQYIEE